MGLTNEIVLVYYSNMSLKQLSGILMLVFPLTVSIVDAQTITSAPLSSVTPSQTAGRQVIKDQFQQARQDLKKQIQAAREIFQQKLKTIRDERKQLLVQKIDTKISTFNMKHTDKMNEALTKLTTILTHLTERSANLKAGGANTLALDAAITQALAAVNASKIAVGAQATREYVITITTESALKTNVGAVVSKFRQEMTNTHKTVVDAKQAVINAAMELNKLKQSGTTPNASNAAKMQ